MSLLLSLHASLMYDPLLCRVLFLLFLVYFFVFVYCISSLLLCLWLQFIELHIYHIITVATSLWEFYHHNNYINPIITYFSFPYTFFSLTCIRVLYKFSIVMTTIALLYVTDTSSSQQLTHFQDNQHNNKYINLFTRVAIITQVHAGTQYLQGLATLHIDYSYSPQAVNI